jgi:adhesin transport system outer membrane protein
MIRSTLRRAAIIFSLAVSVEASAAGSDPVQPSNDELASIVDRVVDTHPAVVAARSTLAAAESDLDGSKWARFPGLTVEGFVDGRDNGRASTVVSLEQPIWSFGRINAGISQAEARVDAARAGVDEAALDLALRASVAYIEYQRLQARDRIYAESVQEHTRLVDSIQRRVDQQISAESDAAYALQRLLTVQQEREQNQVGATLALSRLRELTGMQDLEVKAVLRFSAEEHQPSSDGMLRAALDYSPLNRRLSAEVDAAVAETAVRKAQIWPQLNLQAARYSGGGNADLGTRVGLVMRLQTDGGLSRVSAVRAAEQREVAVRSAADAALRDVREQLMADLSENTSAASRIDLGSRAIAASRTVTDSYLRQFTAGRRSWPEVLNVVREGLIAGIVEVDAQASAMSSAWRLRLRTGQWRPGEQPSTAGVGAVR